MTTNSAETRRRSRIWLTGLGALAAAGSLAACDHPDVVAAPPAPPAWVGVCVAPGTYMRVQDPLCGGADPVTGAALSRAGYLWDYYPPSYSGVIAAYNQPIIGIPILHTVPVATSTVVVVIDRGVSASGGSISSVRAAAAASHTQVTARPQTTAAVPTKAASSAATSPPRTSPSASPAPAPARTTAITRGGLGLPRGTR